MRVLHVTPYFAPAFRYGGPPRSVLGLCRALAPAGVDVEVFTTTANGIDELPPDVTRREEFDGVAVRYFPRSFPRRYFHARGLAEALEDALPRFDLAHVHGLWNFPVWATVRQCQRSGLPFVVSPRGMLDGGSLGHHRFRKEIGYRLWERRYLQRAALLHATSLHEERNVARLSLGPDITLLPNGVSAPETPPPRRFRREMGMDESDGLVVFLGRIHPMKRIDLLLSAVERVRRHSPGVRLVLAGPVDGHDARSLLDRASSHEWVSWLGEVSSEQKWGLLAEANVLALCSDSESFGLAVVEAMAMATPVVVTKTCPWEEIEAEGAGLWVEQRAETIAEAVLAILREPDEAHRMGERGRALVRERYRWCAIGRSMARHYERVVEESPRFRL